MDLLVLIETPTKEAKPEIEMHPEIVEIKISKDINIIQISTHVLFASYLYF